MALLVNDVTPRVQYTATASQTVFAYPFAIFADADLKVYLTPTGSSADDTADIITLTTNYTVSGAATTDGGNVTLVVAATAGDIITIIRDIPIERTIDYQNLGDLASETFNDDLDKQIMMTQQNERELETRVMKLRRTDSKVSNLELPVPVAGQVLAWNSSESGLENTDAPTEQTSSATQIYTTDIAANTDTPNTYTTAWYDSNKTPGSGATWTSTDTTTVGNAGLGLHTDGYAYNANGDQYRIEGDLLNIAQHGARLNGTTNNNTLINIIGGLSLYTKIEVPTGTCVVSEVEISTASQHWFGDGEIKTANSANASAITITGDDVRFDVNVNGNKANQSSGTPACIYVNGASRVKVDAEKVYNSRGNCLLVSNSPRFKSWRTWYTGSDVGKGYVIQNGSSRSKMLYCRVDDNYLDGGHITHGGGAASDRCRVIGGSYDDNGDAVSSGTFPSGLRITYSQGTVVRGATATGQTWGAGFIFDAKSSTEFSRDGSISKCEAYGNLDGCIINDYCQRIHSFGGQYNENTKDGLDINYTLYCTSNGDTCNLNGEKGLLWWGALYGSVNGGIFTNNNTVGTTAEDSGINVRRNTTTSTECSKISINNVTARDDQGTKTQTFGVYIEGASTYINVKGGNIAENKTKDVKIAGTAANCYIKISDAGTILDASSGANQTEYEEEEGSELTIAAGVVTATHRYHTLDTEADAASDDIDTINGGNFIGQKLTLVANNTARTIVLKDATGNIQLNGDLTLDNTQDTALLVWNGGSWLDLSRSDNGA